MISQNELISEILIALNAKNRLEKISALLEREKQSPLKEKILSIISAEEDLENG